MKYESRLDTPLKYHRFVEFFLVPVSLVFNGVISYLMISGFLCLNTPGSADWRSLFRYYTGINLASPGGSWIYIAWITGFFLILFFLDLKCFHGLRLWKKYGMHLWLAKNTILTVLTAAGAMLCLRDLRNIMSLDLLVQMIAQQYQFSLAQMTSALRILQILLWILTITSVTILLLNYIYYFKRRRLFRPFYAEPLEEPVRHPAVSPVPEIKRTAKLLYCPQCGKKLTDSDINFCTECGAKLKED